MQTDPDGRRDSPGHGGKVSVDVPRLQGRTTTRKTALVSSGASRMLSLPWQRRRGYAQFACSLSLSSTAKPPSDSET